jgi:transcriptional regulator with XRE-family HTH domain
MMKRRREVTLGTRIREARQREGFTQQQLASRIGVQQGTLSRWERDEYVPHAYLKPRLARALHVHVDVLFPVTTEGSAARLKG